MSFEDALRDGPCSVMVHQPVFAVVCWGYGVALSSLLKKLCC